MPRAEHDLARHHALSIVELLVQVRRLLEEGSRTKQVAGEIVRTCQEVDAESQAPPIFKLLKEYPGLAEALLRFEWPVVVEIPVANQTQGPREHAPIP